ncbi:MAG: sulfate transporter CysZ [Xanthomonadales bacterium]|nr:sulfate transporter CysZ [Xanthomonadales bacterium]
MNIIRLPTISGPAHLLLGFRLLLRPGLRRFVLLPLFGNILLFSAGFAAGMYGLDAAMDSWLGDSYGWVRWLLYPILVLLFLVVSFYGFTLLANLLLAPFNGVLAARVEKLLTGKAPDDLGRSLWAEAGFTIRQESKRIAMIVLLLGSVFLLGLIPIVGIVAAPLGLLLAGWLLAADFSGNAMGNWGFDFSAQRQFRGRHRWAFLSFGLSAMGLALVPVLNFALLPAAVAGSTALCIRLRDAEREHKPDDNPADDATSVA